MPREDRQLLMLRFVREVDQSVDYEEVRGSSIGGGTRFLFDWFAISRLRIVTVRPKCCHESFGVGRNGGGGSLGQRPKRHILEGCGEKSPPA